jgi:hypothetical protein
MSMRLAHDRPADPERNPVMSSHQKEQSRLRVVLTLSWISLAVLLWSSAAFAEKSDDPSLRVSGPYVYAGLDLYLIHGPESLGSRELVPLAEAMEQGKVIVSETSNVSQLTVENTSDQEVYLQAGDIVKGGKQDRVLQVDMVLKPKSGPVPIGSHCVERSRWQQRGFEPSDRFASAGAALNSSGLRAANIRGSQSEVWDNVEKAQKKLSEKLKADVRSSQSATSLQLTLENDQVRAGVEGYVKAFAPLVEAHADVVGYAFAVDGRVKAADVYASHALFLKMWPKLLRASAAEALAERQSATAHTPPTLERIQSFIADIERKRATEQAVGGDPRSVMRETDADLIIETREAPESEQWIHKSYIRK